MSLNEIINGYLSEERKYNSRVTRTNSFKFTNKFVKDFNDKIIKYLGGDFSYGPTYGRYLGHIVNTLLRLDKKIGKVILFNLLREKSDQNISTYLAQVIGGTREDVSKLKPTNNLSYFNSIKRGNMNELPTKNIDNNRIEQLDEKKKRDNANKEAKRIENIEKANLAKQEKCESAWTAYNDFKKKNPLTYMMRRGPKKPIECDEKYRLSKQTVINFP